MTMSYGDVMQDQLINSNAYIIDPSEYEKASSSVDVFMIDPKIELKKMNLSIELQESCQMMNEDERALIHAVQERSRKRWS